jgi:hypothetical protein
MKITPGMVGQAKKRYAEDLVKQGDKHSYNEIKADIELEIKGFKFKK